MDAPAAVDLKPDRQAIVIALLAHPRLVNLKLQFLDDVNQLLSNQHALTRLATTLNVGPDELSAKGRHLVASLTAAAPSGPLAPGDAEVVPVLCLSAAMLHFWGHFTATLSKLTADDAFINDVAGCAGQSSADVRAAIRQFGDLRRMPAGKAGM